MKKGFRVCNDCFRVYDAEVDNDQKCPECGSYNTEELPTYDSYDTERT